MTVPSEAKGDLTIQDYREHPVWYYDDQDEKFRPVLTLDEAVESIDHFRFRAEFTTAAGDQLEGCVSGLGDIAVSIFANGRWYTANKEWRGASEAQIGLLLADTPSLKAQTLSDFFPLEYKTCIRREPFMDRQGQFYLDRAVS